MRIRLSVGFTGFVITAALTWLGGGAPSGQSAPVRIASPADLVLQPVPSSSGEGAAKVEFEFGAGIVRTMVSINGEPLIQLPATAKTLTFYPCTANLRDLPGDRVPVLYEAFDKAGTRVGDDILYLTLGPDTTKPTVRIVSPKNNSFVGPGEAVDVVVAGEESRSAPTWQTGVRRLNLADPVNVQTSETPGGPYACDLKKWTKEHTFRYVVPRNARGGDSIALTGAAEDWAKNIGFAPIDLVVQEGYAGIWTTKGRFVGRNTELPFMMETTFSFKLNPHSGTVECGTASQPYCGSGRVTFDAGHAGQCQVLRTPSSGVFKIRVGGWRQGDQLTGLTLVATERTRAEYRFFCPGGQSNEGGLADAPVGSILPEGITIAIPLRDSTKVVKHESSITRGSGFELDHQVEIYAPRQNR